MAKGRWVSGSADGSGMEMGDEDGDGDAPGKTSTEMRRIRYPVPSLLVEAAYKHHLRPLLDDPEQPVPIQKFSRRLLCHREMTSN